MNDSIETDHTLTVTTDREVWDEQRIDRASKIGGGVNIITLPLPRQLECKGYSLYPVFVDEHGEPQECKTRTFTESDSVLNYDFSDCYIYDYALHVGDSHPLKEDFSPDFGQPWEFTCNRFIRYSGEEKKI